SAELGEQSREALLVNIAGGKLPIHVDSLEARLLHEADARLCERASRLRRAGCPREVAGMRSAAHRNKRFESRVALFELPKLRKVDLVAVGIDRGALACRRNLREGIVDVRQQVGGYVRDPVVAPVDAPSGKIADDARCFGRASGRSGEQQRERQKSASSEACSTSQPSHMSGKDSFRARG